MPSHLLLHVVVAIRTLGLASLLISGTSAQAQASASATYTHATGVTSAATATTSTATPTTPIWSEEFNYSGPPKADLWSHDVGGNGWGNSELQVYTTSTDNSIVQDGILKIIARREGDTFTSARVKTDGKFSFTYGTLEARIRVPQMDAGLWPAFWTMGMDFYQVGWPKSGEIDIMEMGQGLAIEEGVVNKRVISAAHWDIFGQYATYARSYDSAVDLTQDFHIFKMEWTPDTISTYVDGNWIWEIDIGDSVCPSCQELHQPHHILLSLGVGGGFTSGGTSSSAAAAGSTSSCAGSSSNGGCPSRGPGDITAPFPGEMQVDWIRLYSNGHTIITSPPVVATPLPTPPPVTAPPVTAPPAPTMRPSMAPTPRVRIPVSTAAPTTPAPVVMIPVTLAPVATPAPITPATTREPAVTLAPMAAVTLLPVASSSGKGKGRSKSSGGVRIPPILVDGTRAPGADKFGDKFGSNVGKGGGGSKRKVGASRQPLLTKASKKGGKGRWSRNGVTATGTGKGGKGSSGLRYPATYETTTDGGTTGSTTYATTTTSGTYPPGATRSPGGTDTLTDSVVPVDTTGDGSYNPYPDTGIRPTTTTTATGSSTTSTTATGSSPTTITATGGGQPTTTTTNTGGDGYTTTDAGEPSGHTGPQSLVVAPITSSATNTRSSLFISFVLPGLVALGLVTGVASRQQQC